MSLLRRHPVRRWGRMKRPRLALIQGTGPSSRLLPISRMIVRKARKKFSGRIVEEEPECSVDGEDAADLNPLQGAQEEAGELQRVEDMAEGTEYMEDPEPTEAEVKEPARSPFIPRKPPVQRAASRFGIPQLTTVATNDVEEQTGQDEAQLDTVMEEGQIETEQTGWESVEARPAHIRKNTKDMCISTTVNQAKTSAIHQLDKQIQINENAIRESNKELAAARKAAPVGMNSGGSRVTQAQSQTATGLLIQMETLNPSQIWSVHAASVPVTLQGHPILTKASSSGNPVVNGRISLPPVVTSGLASNPVPIPATMSAPRKQTVVSAPDRAQEQVPIPVVTTIPSVITTTQADGERY
ncbi:hypothetical protein R1sor_024065 [Riccia sorocarpa]|uniref:Uncharacterized protein n=1 Tax=Riccia sorocarpa TaxID=122646 RepID=A0ABD3GVF3_9MARC